ncbi:MAG TPA: ATP-binding protein, partial [Nitrosomonas sp.]|nr:ATP-binding protein [Nitrosomonas sp.]
LLNAQDALVEIEEPMIEIQTETTRDGIKLTIKDNGCGFPDEVRSRVFEPYVTTKAKGTGLGLPIVKKIVEEHEGTITIQNLKPLGAQITITLPSIEKSKAA